MTSEWDIEQLDLAGYLGRIDYDGDTRPTARTLAALHRAHIDAIPFENLDIVLGRGIAVDLESVQGKLVTVTRPDGSTEQREVAGPELAGTLEEVFGLLLGPAELGGL